MTKRKSLLRSAALSVLLSGPWAWAQQAGSIRGVVRDAEFDTPVAGAQVQIVETGTKVTTNDEGNFSFGQLPPGKYTLIIVKDGYVRQVKSELTVSGGEITDVSANLAGEVTEMEEFVVQDIKLGGGTEEGLLQLRMEKPALVDSVSSQLMNLAGAGDAAAGLRLVAGATVQDGKYAVVRGLPDRYVVSVMNSVRLPTADADKRAVQLDQFPAAAIESIQVSKTFTPDQQGDASGGAVNLVLKGVPEKPFLQFKFGSGFNTRDPGDGKFLTYRDGGVRTWGRDDGRRDIQPEFYDPLNSDGVYEGAAGVSRGDQPFPYNWSLAGGGSIRLSDEWRLGGLVSGYYETKNSYWVDGVDDKAWVVSPGAPITPQYRQGDPSQGEFKTSMFDITRMGTEVKYGGLGVIGLESANHKLKLAYLGTSNTEDVATLAEDTRGKSYFFPGYDPKDPNSPGFTEFQAAPWLRNETLAYTERTTQTLQLSGWHRFEEVRTDGTIKLLPPELDWTVAGSTADLNEPDKRRFGSLWIPGYTIPPHPTVPGRYEPAKDAANFTLGNLQRTWKEITEDSQQYFLNVKVPFEQWSETQGYFKIGLFHDQVDRDYKQESFSNFNDTAGGYIGEWNDYWTAQFPSTYHKVTAAEIDVDYKGQQEISAWYLMADVPLAEWFSIIGGVRFESTDLSIVNFPEAEVTWVPPGATTPVTLNPGDADVEFTQDDVLPSIGVVIKPIKNVTVRGSYSQTVARQTFKELTPIQQQEYLGADIFVGNPQLGMSAVENYDLRLDYTPFEGSLISVSWFYKSLTDPIEYVQRNVGFVYTTAVNYPEGRLDGFEIEVRQKIGEIYDRLSGLTLGFNATFINSNVTLPEEEAAKFEERNIQAPMKSRDMTGTPEYLYNIFATYDIAAWKTQLGLFYTVRGDTLVAGAGTGSGVLVPSVYDKEYGTLNASVTVKLGGPWSLKVQAKNLLDPKIQSVYRDHTNGEEYLKTEYRRGTEYWFTLGAEF